MPLLDKKTLHRVAQDALRGGKSDKIPPSAFPKKKVEEGAKVEREHTDCPAVAREIARDHLTEDPNYYAKLKKMEKQARVDGHYHVARTEQDAAAYTLRTGRPVTLHRDAYKKTSNIPSVMKGLAAAAVLAGGAHLAHRALKRHHRKEKHAMVNTTLEAFSDELEKIALKSYIAPAVGGALIGGAMAPQGETLSGAAKGAVGGAVLAHGYKHGKRFHKAVKPHAEAAGIKNMSDVASHALDTEKRKVLSETAKKGWEDAQKLKLG